MHAFEFWFWRPIAEFLGHVALVVGAGVFIFVCWCLIYWYIKVRAWFKNHRHG